MEKDYNFLEEAKNICGNEFKPENKRESIIAMQSYLKGIEMGQKAYKYLIDKVELFNTLFKEGTTMNVVDDFGTCHERVLESKAFILGGHTAVAKFSDIGIYDLKRVRLKKVHKTN